MRTRKVTTRNIFILLALLSGSTIALAADADPTAATPDLREALLRLRQPEQPARPRQPERDPVQAIQLRGRLIIGQEAVAIIASAPDRLHILRVGESFALPNDLLRVEAITLDSVVLIRRSNQTEIRLR